MVKELLTKADFDAALAEAGGKLVVIDFSAAWCGPCKMIAPKYEAMSQEFTDVIFYKIDVDTNDETSESEGIQAMPTFIFYREGKRVDSLRGANEAKLREMIERYK